METCELILSNREPRMRECDGRSFADSPPTGCSGRALEELEAALHCCAEELMHKEAKCNYCTTWIHIANTTRTHYLNKHCEIGMRVRNAM